MTGIDIFEHCRMRLKPVKRQVCIIGGDNWFYKTWMEHTKSRFTQEFECDWPDFDDINAAQRIQ